MRGFLLLGERQTDMRDFPDPEPGPHDVVLEMKASGICGSDLRPYRGARRDPAQAFISSHEPCGVVAAVGDAVTDWRAGDAMGARVIAVDVAPERLELALQRGASEAIDARTQDPVKTILQLTHGEGADATLDATGNPEARVNAVRAARTFGRACFVGEGNTTTFDVSPQIIHKQLTIHGSWTFSAVGMEECARFVVDRQVPLRDLITHTFSLDEAADAFHLFDAGKTGKCVISFN